MRASRVEGRLTGRSLPAASGAIVGVACVVTLAFLAGYALGRPGPTNRPLTVAARHASPAPAIQQASIDPSLRDAVGASARDGWAICVAGASPECSALAHRAGGPAQPGSYMFRFCQQGYCLSDVDPRALPWTAVDAGDLVLAAPASGAAAHAVVFDWDQPGRLPPSVSLDPAAHDTSSFYFDLAGTGRGLRLAVVSVLTPVDARGAGSFAEWTTYLAGLAVGVAPP